MKNAYAQVSTKFQIVIPKEIREKLHLKPKQKLIVMERGGIIHLVPYIPLSKAHGILKGMGLDCRDLREKEDLL